MKVVREDLDRGLSGEHARAGQEMVGHRSDRIHVAPGVDLGGRGDDLGRHVERGTQDGVGVGRARVRPAVQVLDEPKVEDLDEVGLQVPLAQEEIRRLDVAMDEPQLVGLPQRATRLGQEMDHATRRLRPVDLDEFLQVEPLEVLHRIVEGAVGGPAVVVNHDGVRMSQAGGELRFPLEPLQALAAGAGEELDRRGTAQHGVPSTVHDPHAPLPQAFLQGVLAQAPRFAYLSAQPIQNGRDGRRKHDREHTTRAVDAADGAGRDQGRPVARGVAEHAEGAGQRRDHPHGQREERRARHQERAQREEAGEGEQQLVHADGRNGIAQGDPEEAEADRRVHAEIEGAKGPGWK